MDMETKSNQDFEENDGLPEPGAEELPSEKTGEWPESWQDKETSEQEEQGISLRHMGQTRLVSREEARTLAQKGLDYDRIRRERDEMRPKFLEMEALLSSLSRHSGLEPQELIRRNEAARLMEEAQERGESLSRQEAMEKIGKISEYDSEAAEKLRIRENLLSFSQRFPEVNAEDISPEIWRQFYDGGELSALYAMEENGRLRQELELLRQGQRNSARSTGSRAGLAASADLSLRELWAED